MSVIDVKNSNENSCSGGGGGLSKEEAKNMALLFFMDHLMTKNGRRTVHDLSCQFGARGFSAEMREAVGSTQEGLTEFLAQFPSLFVVDGDTVTMTGYGDLAAGGAKASPLLAQNVSRDRNYEQEAVHFFEEKLKKFGPELQIKSLLGHRSQSAPEIRLVSGRHVKDFTDFLMSHPNDFVVENDRVRLRHMPEPTQDHSSTDDNDGDSDDNNENVEPPSNFLHESDRPRGAGAAVLFNFLPPSPQQQQQQQHSSPISPMPNNNNGFGAESAGDEFGRQNNFMSTAFSNDLNNNKARQKALQFLKSVVETNFANNDGTKQNFSLSNNSAAGGTTTTNVQQQLACPIPVDVLYKKFCDRFAHKTRQQVATNPKELLQFLKMNRNIFFIRSNKVSIVRNASANNNNNGKLTATSSSTTNSSSASENGDSAASPEAGGQAQVLKLDGIIEGQRQPTVTVVKSLLAAQNALIDIARYLQLAQEAAFSAQQQQQRNNNIGSTVAAATVSPMMSPYAVAVDFKCVSLGDRQFLSLVVVCSGDGSKIYVFDVGQSSSVLMESGLKEMLEDEDVVKVIHDCRKIVNVLFDQYKISLRNVFDTQIAHVVLQHCRSGKPLHDIDKPIAFSNLQSIYCNNNNHQAPNLAPDYSTPSVTKNDSIWSKRPLTDELVNMCTDEVRYLTPFIYESMCNSLKQHQPPEMKNMFERLCYEATCCGNGNGQKATFAMNGLVSTKMHSTNDDSNFSRQNGAPSAKPTSQRPQFQKRRDMMPPSYLATSEGYNSNNNGKNSTAKTRYSNNGNLYSNTSSGYCNNYENNNGQNNMMQNASRNFSSMPCCRCSCHKNNMAANFVPKESRDVGCQTFSN